MLEEVDARMLTDELRARLRIDVAVENQGVADWTVRRTASGCSGCVQL